MRDSARNTLEQRGWWGHARCWRSVTPIVPTYGKLLPNLIDVVLQPITLRSTTAFHDAMGSHHSW